jgi:hypothetical protein
MDKWWATRRDSQLRLALRLKASDPEEDELDQELERLRLASNLLLLARIDHKHEYDLCYSAVWHVLGRPPFRPRR